LTFRSGSGVMGVAKKGKKSKKDKKKKDKKGEEVVVLLAWTASGPATHRLPSTGC
jgi:hypothetical protein